MRDHAHKVRLTGSVLVAFILCLGTLSCASDDKPSSTDPSTNAPSADAAISEMDAGPPDQDDDGFAGADDCDDTNPNIHPDAAEVCDGVDNNCDGAIDGDDAVDRPSWYLDGDGDGFGVKAEAVLSCEAPDGYVAKSGDCDDDDEDINPFADELCDNRIDDDCNGHIDEHGAADEKEWYEDRDGDGYGTGNPVLSCGPPFEGSYATEDGDCDDSDRDVYPGSMTEDTPEDGVDQNCNGSDDD
jgi:hypothetical protein